MPSLSSSRARPAVSVKKLRVGFILAHQFTLSAFANFVDVLRLAADEGDRSRPINCEWHVLSKDMTPIRSSSGLHIHPDARLGRSNDYDYIVVVGGLLDEVSPISAEYIRFLQEAANAKVGLVGICTGAFILHRAGLMEDYQCCVSWFHHEDFLEQFDGLTPISDQIFVVDRNRLTCSGGVSSAHLAAFLVDRHVGSAAAQKSLHIMIIDALHQGEAPQPGLPLELTTKDPLVRKALVRMQHTLHTPQSVQQIADGLGVSRRKLERHFANSLDLSPLAAATRIRIAQAKLLLREPDTSLTEVAAQTGFCDTSHLLRVFRKHEGMTPSVFRNMPENRQ
ncbi:GlxA family transcriptional regulator [Roseibium limicola]|uniref:GlxA family transcriptional regulator n=1 Tax=Roseibium limicola TaxID=2816037 RepID=A0A939EK91_9HYPH|nr:GlxA family transcriptional regulator [Roseibium limicola]MBO0344200.1 GlxA family transcriptional regulator [Roseibium limicola]